jgi:hypothetical protein
MMCKRNCKQLTDLHPDYGVDEKQHHNQQSDVRQRLKERRQTEM